MPSKYQIKKVRQLKALWHRQNGHCAWCHMPMLYPTGDPSEKGVPMDHMSCTLDHLDCRLSPDRGKHFNERRRVAACWICNHRRGAMQEAQLTPEEFRVRCHNHHPWKKWNEP